MTYVFNVHHRSVLFGVYMSMVFVSNLPGLIETLDSYIYFDIQPGLVYDMTEL